MRDRMMELARMPGLLVGMTLWLAGICLVLMTAFVAIQVFARYVLNSPLTWTEPASILLMGWFIFLGAAVGIREGYHLGFDVVPMYLPARLVLHSLFDVAVMGFGFGMLRCGTELVAGTWSLATPACTEARSGTPCPPISMTGRWRPVFTSTPRPTPG